MELNRTAAMVTGAASGLGEATARALAGAGAYVVVADVNDEAGKEVAASIGGHFAHTDVTDESAVQGAVDAAVPSGHPLRVAVSRAGIGVPSRTAHRDGSPPHLPPLTRPLAPNPTPPSNSLPFP